MKPEPRRRGGRFALSAARTALRAELGWLRGHPTGAPAGGALPWRVVPHPATRGAPEAQVVDRERLRTATHALLTLPRRFPRALPRVVGDVRAWAERARGVIDELTVAIHEGRPLATTAADPPRPGLAPLVRDLSWVHACDPDRRRRALELLAAFALEAEVVAARGDDAVVMQLLDLALDDPRGPGLPTLALLGREALWTTSLTADPGDLERLAAALDHQCPERRWRPLSRAAAPGPSTLALVRGVLAQDAAARDRALEVLTTALPVELVERWASWWRDADELTAKVRRRVLGAERDGDARPDADALRALARRRPATVRPSRLREAVAGAVGQHPGTTERLLEVLRGAGPLEALSPREPARLELACLVAGEPRQAGPALDVLARVQRAVPGALGARLVFVARCLLEEGRRLERLAPALTEALIQLARDGRLDDLDATRWPLLVEHAAVARDGRAAVPLLRAVDGLEVPWAVVDAVAALCAREPERAGVVVRGLGKAEWTRGLGDALTDLARRDDLRPLLLDALAAGEGARVRRLAVRASLVRGLGGAEALRRVAAPSAPEAESSAGPERLRRELAALERLAPMAPHPRARWMWLRVASLCAQLAGEVAPSPRRARAAERRRARRATRRALDGWAQALEACGEHGLAAWLGQPLPRAWIDEPRRLRVVAALADLSARERGMRGLAALVLRARLGPPPWDLRDAPANAAFLERLRARGVAPGPWLDSTARRAWTAKGRELALALEDDPLEVLRMGEPFRTCLSPGESNFFAALVDAADVNKRVLYARDAAGQIVGRCLLALTAEGAIVTYHAYCHDAALGVAEQVRPFVQDLARAMGTRVVSRGEVPRLLASDWYCDAPEDLVGAGAALERALQPVLSSVAPEELPLALEQALGAPLDADTFERLVERTELDERPELAVGLAPLVASARPCARARVRLVERLIGAGAHDAARTIARAVRVDSLEPLDAAALATSLLTLGRAHAAHEALRRTAPRGPEVAPARHEAWGLVCEALHREAAAREHYARGAEARHADPARDRCRARLAALDERRRARAG